MKFLRVRTWAVVFLVAGLGKADARQRERDNPSPLDWYNISWPTPSTDSSGSMPLGNGDIGINLWVEEGGDLLFYISKTDAWSENAQFLKLGRVRVKLSPTPFRKGSPFLQTLKLQQGEITIRAGQPASAITLRIWVDANQPVIRIEAGSPKPFQLETLLEVWRNRERTLEGKELDAAYGMEGSPHPVVVLPDTILPAKDDRIVWFHRNTHSIWPETMKLQGLEPLMKELADPLLNRTFGGAIQGKGLIQVSQNSLKSSMPRKQFVLSMYALNQQTASTEEWLRSLDDLMLRIEGKSLEHARESHRKWWRDFWSRSWIRISGSVEAENVSRGYALQRFLNGCAGRGKFPIKFNGSIFTVDARQKEEIFDADYRRWGGPYWFQNTRLAYWPMPASGDLDLMQPLFRMFLEAMPLSEKRTRLYFGHEGAFFPETMYFWGTYANTNYGWDRRGKSVSQVDNPYIRYYWQGGLELSAMMLDYFDYSQDAHLLSSTLLPLADAIVRFYDQHYPRDTQGKLLLKPAAALETWHEAVNPLPEIAGLGVVLNGLLSLPPGTTTDDRRATWKRLREELPVLPVKEENGNTRLLAAQELIGPVRNIENPELYAVFPYRLYGVGKPGLEAARYTFEQRRIKKTGGWHQDAIQAAYLGLTEAARSDVRQNFSTHHERSRFPAFWGPNYDWIPDQDHGNVALMALQSMLMQAEGSRILLFPAWPKFWDVQFKLRAPSNTAVEGVYRAGRLERLVVTPEGRRKDLVKMDPQ